MVKRALLIGINQYAIGGANLLGCVNDVKNVRRVLTSHFGFRSADITMLTDHAATTKAIQSASTKLVKSAKAGDVLLLHYSGHGSNVPDNDGDEADHRDEILCPTDLDWKNPLRDDFLRRTFNKLGRGVSLTVLMDCCHSGTITRAVPPIDAARRERYLPSPWDLVAAESGRRLRGTVAGQLRVSSPARRRQSDVIHADISEIMIAACRDSQTSADAYINGSYNGAFTYYLVDAIDRANGQITYRELHEKTCQKLRRAHFDQVPQLEGHKSAFDRPFLSPKP